jgi:hypothetical protein
MGEEDLFDIHLGEGAEREMCRAHFGLVFEGTMTDL